MQTRKGAVTTPQKGKKMAMNSIKYHKAISENGKVRYVESWGEKLRIKLPCGNVLILACEYGLFRGERSWMVTDTASGIFVHNKALKSQKARDKFLSNPDVLQLFSREIAKPYYKKAVADLDAFEDQFKGEPLCDTY